MKDKKLDVVENVEDLLPTPFESKPTSFTEVTRAIHGEREYQKQRWADGCDDGEGPDDRSIVDFLRYIETYHKMAEQAMGVDNDDPEAALHAIRKITALGYACMETHGAPKRDGF